MTTDKLSESAETIYDRWPFPREQHSLVWSPMILWSSACCNSTILKKRWNYEDRVCCLQDRPYISRAGLLFAMIGCCQPCPIKVKDLTETCPYKETQRGIFHTKFQDYELTFVIYPTLCRNMSVIFIYEDLHNLGTLKNMVSSLSSWILAQMYHW